MFDATSPSEAVLPEASAPPALERTVGVLDLAAVRLFDGRTRLHRMFQSGAGRVRLPRVNGGGAEAVLINTAGGLTGGDRFRVRIEAGEGSRLTVTTQAAEKIYRAGSGRTEIATTLAVAAGARLDFIPQETILFDASRLDRRLDADIDAAGELIVHEAVVFGRTASAEHVRAAAFSDRWRIRRDGRLIFAENLRLDGDIATMLQRPAVAAGGVAVAIIVKIAPDAEAGLEAVRGAISRSGEGEGGASAWNGMLVVRLVAADGFSLRSRTAAVLETLRGGELPRVWHC